MTNQELNSKVKKLFRTWRNEHVGQEVQNDSYYQELEKFKKECLKVHSIVGAYSAMTDKNALKMAAICSAIRFTQPYQMLMELQHRTNSY